MPQVGRGAGIRPPGCNKLAHLVALLLLVAGVVAEAARPAHRRRHQQQQLLPFVSATSKSSWGQPAQAAVGRSCALALAAACSHGGRSAKSIMQCDNVCAGKHSHDLQAAGCTSAEVQAWCASANSIGGEPIDARKDFGCKGDGVADDTACLQAALDAGGIQRRKIYIPGGTYLVSRSLLIKGSNSSMYNESYSHEPITGDGKMSTHIQAINNSNWGPSTDNLAVILFPSCCGALPQSGAGFYLSDLTVDANHVADCESLLTPPFCSSSDLSRQDTSEVLAAAPPPCAY